MAKGGASSEGAGAGGEDERAGDRGGGDRDSERWLNWGEGGEGEVAATDDDANGASMGSGDVVVDDVSRKCTPLRIPAASSAPAPEETMDADGVGDGSISWSS
jgi:hypothetical protein